MRRFFGLAAVVLLPLGEAKHSNLHPVSHKDKGSREGQEPPSSNTGLQLAPAVPGLLFYSFFVAMPGGHSGSSSYAAPFANKQCYMAKHGYPWLLDMVPLDVVPKRKTNSGGLHMAPTWYKPGAIATWLQRVDFLAYLDMDLVVMDDSVSFADKFVGRAVDVGGGEMAVPDLVVTDHNRVLNNGAFVLRNSPWGRKFVARWQKISNTKFVFPFSDNGAFIETVLSFLPAYRDTNHRCMKPRVSAGDYLDCAVKFMDEALGPFRGGEQDRLLRTDDGGLVRFVSPRVGFNSHRWNEKRPSQHWDRGACFADGHGFVLHTKDWDKEMPRGSQSCPVAQAHPLTLASGAHLYGNWGRCSWADQSCAARVQWHAPRVAGGSDHERAAEETFDAGVAHLRAVEAVAEGAKLAAKRSAALTRRGAAEDRAASAAAAATTTTTTSLPEGGEGNGDSFAARTAAARGSTLGNVAGTAAAAATLAVTSLLGQGGASLVAPFPPPLLPPPQVGLGASDDTSPATVETGAAAPDGRLDGGRDKAKVRVCVRARREIP